MEVHSRTPSAAQKELEEATKEALAAFDRQVQATNELSAALGKVMAAQKARDDELVWQELVCIRAMGDQYKRGRGMETELDRVVRLRHSVAEAADGVAHPGDSDGHR